MDEFGRDIPPPKEHSPSHGLDRPSHSRSRSPIRNEVRSPTRSRSRSPVARRRVPRPDERDNYRRGPRQPSYTPPPRRSRGGGRRTLRGRDSNKRRFSRSRTPSPVNGFSSDDSIDSAKELRRDTEDRLADLASIGPLKSFKEFVEQMHESERAIKDKAQIDAAYDDYVKRWRFRASSAYFALHRHEEWFRQHYAAPEMEHRRKSTQQKIKMAADAFAKRLDTAAKEGTDSLKSLLPEVMEVTQQDYKHAFRQPSTDPADIQDLPASYIVVRDAPLWLTIQDVTHACTALGEATYANSVRNAKFVSEVIGKKSNSHPAPESDLAEAPLPIEVFASDPLRLTGQRDQRTYWVKFATPEIAEALVRQAGGMLDVKNTQTSLKDVQRLREVQKARVREMVDAAQIEVGNEERMNDVRASLEEVPGVLQQLSDFAASSGRRRKRAKRQLEKNARELDATQRRFIKLVSQKVEKMKKSDLIVQFALESEVSTTTTDAVSEAEESTEVIPPPPPLPESVSLRIEQYSPQPRRPLPDICSQLKQAQDDFHRALMLARALDIEHGLSPVPKITGSSETSDDSTADGFFESVAKETSTSSDSVRMICTNSWLEHCSTNIDEVLAKLPLDDLSADERSTVLRKLDTIILYIARVFSYDFYRGVQCADHGDYLHFVGAARLQRLVIQREGVSNEETVDEHSDAHMSEGEAEQANEDEEHEQGHEDEEHEQEEEDEDVPELTKQPSVDLSHDSDAVRGACGAVCLLGYNKGNMPHHRNRNSRGPTMTLTDSVAQATAIRLRTARRRIAVEFSAIPENTLNEVEKVAIEFGRKLADTRHSNGEAQNTFLAALTFPNLSRAIDRQLAYFQRVFDVEQLSAAAKDTKKKCNKLIESISDPQIMEAWYHSVCIPDAPTGSHTGSEDDIRTRCKLCNKLFSARRYVIKHLHNKHSDLVEDALVTARKAVERVLMLALADQDAWKRYYNDSARPLFVSNRRRYDARNNGPMGGPHMMRIPPQPMWPMYGAGSFGHPAGMNVPGPMNMNMPPRAMPMGGGMYGGRGPISAPNQRMGRGGYRDSDAPPSVHGARPPAPKPDYGSSLVSYDDI